MERAVGVNHEVGVSLLCVILVLVVLHFLTLSFLYSFDSNQTTGWERIVLALGDRLLQLGQCQAAHVCYLVSYSTFGSPSNESTRLVLLGCDHRIYMNRMLMTPQSIQSFERSEAFEWARRRGNRKTSIPSLQPFKLRYAELLADFGYEDLAREYLLSIRSCIGLDSDERKGGKVSATNASGNLVHELEFIESLKRLDDRICGSTGAEPSSWDNKDDRRGSLAAVGSIVKSVLGKKPKAEDVPLSKTTDKPKSTEKSQMAEVEDESPREVAQLSMPPQQSFPTPLNTQTTNDVLDTTLEGDESFITTKTSFEKVATDAPEEVQQEDRLKSPTTLLSNPFSHNMGKPNDEQQQQDAPSSAPLMFSLDQEPKPKEEVEKKKETILSTPVSKKKEDKEKAPVSEPPSK